MGYVLHINIMPIRSSENASWRCVTISGSPISSESLGAKRLVWLSSEELDMLRLVVISDSAKGIKASWGCWRQVIFKLFSYIYPSGLQ